ncbi:uncharacterized protein BDR25DRAFT_348900 [Lindgomyces ingoldianus]|uniref:Uncharacterized protein n=1 Tax=Lindgomyces ingoldianus TaxID=673940 RepID=A0ACB6RCK9_9PLEO|nr:uncharacterized protein BDR25DRAFT_348900 [Lindgomyces ingoldianus]KAF2476994.1 hypothetical protein BDR25DRAFT_348900 [Lindgomyces ingoldianus]
MPLTELLTAVYKPNSYNISFSREHSRLFTIDTSSSFSNSNFPLPLPSSYRSITEFARCSLAPGIFLTGPTSSAFTAPAPRLRSVELENPSILWGFVDGDSVEDYIAYTKTETNAKIEQALGPYCSGFLQAPHLATLGPNSPFSHVTEIFTAYFPPNLATSPLKSARQYARLPTKPTHLKKSWSLRVFHKPLIKEVGV